VIDKLSKDNEAIKTELDTELRFLSRRAGGGGGGAGGEASANLHTQLDLYIGKAEIEHRNIESLSKQVEILRGKVVKESRVIGGMNAAKEAERQMDKKAKVLENRVEKALVRFNEALAANKELRNVIDTLRQERSVFEGVYAKLERELAEKKRAMAALIESSNQAYEARDLAQMEAAKIQQESNAERIVFEQQLAAMDAAVDAEVESARVKEEGMRGTLSMEEEDQLKRDLRSGQKELATAESQARAYAARVSAYEGAFTRIRDETGIDEVEELVQVFLKNEDANFALFNHVADQSAEVARLEEVVSKLRDEALSFEAGRRVLGGGDGGLGALGIAGGPAGPSAAATGGRRSSTGGMALGAAGGVRGGGGGGGGGVLGASSSSSASDSVGSGGGAPPAALSALAASVTRPHYSRDQNAQLVQLCQGIERSLQKQADTRRALEVARVALSEMVPAIGADEMPGAALILTDMRVTEANLTKALGLVEQRANALLAGYAALTKAAAEEKQQQLQSQSVDSQASEDAYGSPERRAAVSLGGVGPLVRPGAASERLHPALPAISDFAAREADGADGDDDEEDEDGVARPLTLAEIKSATERQLGGGGAGGRGGYY
jgi:hypothetical protein